MARILLIDDDAGIRNVVRATLSQFGHTVIEARDGEEGLKLFKSGGADLLITDIVMPEMGGLEVLMELRKKQPLLKAIAISGGGRLKSTQYLHMAKLMGAVKMLEKPFTLEALIAAVNEVLPDGKAPA